MAALTQRSLQRRLRQAQLGRFKLMADFDWNWPRKIDRDLVERALTLDFIPEVRNFILIGNNGLFARPLDPSCRCHRSRGPELPDSRKRTRNCSTAQNQAPEVKICRYRLSALRSWNPIRLCLTLPTASAVMIAPWLNAGFTSKSRCPKSKRLLL